MTPLIKICGTTSPADARLAIAAGADFVGMVLHPPSPRFVAPENLAAISEASQETNLILVTVNLPLSVLRGHWGSLKPAALQLHGDESPELVRELVAEGITVWKVLSGNSEKVRRDAETYTAAGADAVLVDAREVTEQGIVYGGTGHMADWNAARRLVEEGCRLMLAGGLTPENVGRAIEYVRPWAVDVVSGVEARKGIKDAAKVQAFCCAARGVASATH